MSYNNFINISSFSNLIQNNSLDFIDKSNVADYFSSKFEKLNICPSVKLHLESLSENDTYKNFIEFIFPALPQLKLEDFSIIPENPGLSLLLAALSLKDPTTGQTLVPPKMWREQASLLEAKELVLLMQTLFISPELVAKVPFGEVSSLLIKRHGGCDHTFAEFANLLMHIEGESYSTITLRENSLYQALKQAHVEQIPGRAFPILEGSRLSTLAEKSVEVFGRTLVHFESSEGATGIAYKFRREGESIATFCKEQIIAEIFRQNGQFLSDLPKPEGVFRVKEELPASLQALLEGQSVDYDQLIVYVQEVSSGYYRYLQEIQEDETWRESRKRFLVDTGVQVASGYFPDMAPLYHHEENLRRYQPLVDLAPMERLGSGAGYLEAPFPKLRWPNAGETGIRDVGDGSQLDHLIKSPMLEAFDLWHLKTGKMSYFLMNALAKAFLVDTLQVFSRFEKMANGPLSWEDKKTVESVAAALKEGKKWILQGFTGYDEETCSQFVDAFPVNWHRQALQLIFWLQVGKKGYASYLEKKQLPPELYEEHMKVEIDLSQYLNFDPLKGFFSREGEREIGVYDGPLGWPEHEKAWYGISAIAVGVYYHDHAEIKEGKTSVASFLQPECRGKRAKTRESFSYSRISLTENEVKREYFPRSTARTRLFADEEEEAKNVDSPITERARARLFANVFDLEEKVGNDLSRSTGGLLDKVKVENVEPMRTSARGRLFHDFDLDEVKVEIVQPIRPSGLLVDEAETPKKRALDYIEEVERKSRRIELNGLKGNGESFTGY